MMLKQEVLHELPLAEEAMRELIEGMARGEIPLPPLEEGASARISVVGEANAYTIVHGRPERCVVRIYAKLSIIEDDTAPQGLHQMYADIA